MNETIFIYYLNNDFDFEFIENKWESKYVFENNEDNMGDMSNLKINNAICDIVKTGYFEILIKYKKPYENFDGTLRPESINKIYNIILTPTETVIYNQNSFKDKKTNQQSLIDNLCTNSMFKSLKSLKKSLKKSNKKSLKKSLKKSNKKSLKKSNKKSLKKSNKKSLKMS